MEYEAAGDASEDDYSSAVYPELDLPGSSSIHCIQLVDERDTTTFLRGRVLADEVDIVMIKGWLDSCEREHGTRCSTTPFGSSSSQNYTGTLLVIDVHQQCLIQLPDGQKYVALSYVWGPANWPRTMTSNLNLYKKVNFFRNEKLPKTISHAVELVEALGMRYLWVDSLCLVQDDPMKQSMIQGMDAVYGDAYLCLIAASEDDAHAGLSGWSDKDRRRDAMDIGYLSSDLRVGVPSHFDSELKSCSHAQRAWT